MEANAQDGNLIQSELTDDAVLTGPLFSEPIRGRKAIIAAIAILDAILPKQALRYRQHTDVREYILTDAQTIDGLQVQILTVGFRDNSGWICQITMDHTPPPLLDILSKRFRPKFDRASK
jgi:hypothetical protein